MRAWQRQAEHFVGRHVPSPSFRATHEEEEDLLAESEPEFGPVLRCRRTDAGAAGVDRRVGA